MDIQTVLSVCGGISIVGGALAIIWKVIAPLIRIAKKFEDMDKAHKDYTERIAALEEMQKQQSKCLAAILNHMITGNGVEHMKEIRDELLESIIEK